MKGNRLTAGLLATLLILLADQGSKWWMLEALDLPGLRNLPLAAVGPLGLDLTMVWNRGVTFGLLSGEQPWNQALLALVAAAVAAFLLRWMARAETGWVALALGAVIGGAIGNVIDRLRFGAVVDFIDVHLTLSETIWHWYVFNIADAGIVCGVGVLVVDAVFRRSPTQTVRDR
jgi:lipoprotein signal peptidase